MDARMTTIAQKCPVGSYDNSMSFPDVVAAMMTAGFESYFVDSRTNTRTRYLPSGKALVLPNPEDHGPVSEPFDGAAIAAAIRWAQSGAAEYAYAALSRRGR